jgi:hypothetical protein
MPGYRDLRDVLDIDLDSQNNCVGEAKTYRRRCKVRISKPDLRTASRLLDQMDRSKRIAPEDLKELAAFILCKNFHNCRSKPHLNQIDEVSGLWSKIIAEGYSREKKEKEEAEMIDAEKLLAEIRESMKKVRDDSKLEELEKVCSFTIAAYHDFRMADIGHSQISRAKPVPSEAFASSSRANIDDTFETRASSSARPNIFTQTSPRNSTQNTEILPADFATVPNTELSVREEKKVAGPFGMPKMPSPPTHEPSPTKAPRTAITKQQEIETTTGCLNNHESIPTSKFAFAFGSKSGNTPPFEFETPTKAKTAHAEHPRPRGLVNVTAYSGSNFGGLISLIAPVSEKEKPSEESKRIPLQEKVTMPLSVVFSTNTMPSAYEFGSREKKLSSPFEFEIPLKLQQSSKLNYSTARPAALFEVTPPEDNDIRISSDARAFALPSKQPEESGLRSSAPTNDPQPPFNKANDIPARPTTPQNLESFGYANITPNSTRYTAYLPARQQHGLVTPPETPEFLIRALSKPRKDSGHFRNGLPREASSPVPKVVRKPLPSSPPAKADDGGEERKELFAICGGMAGQDVGDYRSGNVEAEVRTGCIARFTLRRVKEKVKGKLKAATRSISREKGDGSPGSSKGIALE